MAEKLWSKEHAMSEKNETADKAIGHLSPSALENLSDTQTGSTL